MTIIQPPSNSRPITENEPADLTICCRAAYVTPLCFSNKAPKWIVHWTMRGPQAYCDDCIYIVRDIIKLRVNDDIRIEEIK